MEYSTTKIRPFETTAPEPWVVVKAFNSRSIAWKDSCLSWLNEMRDQRFGLIEGHTLELLSGYRCRNLILLVVERSTAPIKPLPHRIFFAHWTPRTPETPLELTFWSGHDVHIDCNESPPITRINRHFWEQLRGRGKTPHFEKHVQPLIGQLVSNFEGGQAWAS